MKRLPRLRVVPRGGVLALVLLFILSACSSSGSSGTTPTTASPGQSEGSPVTSDAATATPELAKIKLGVSTPSFSFTPVYVADAKGFWKDQNLDVGLTVFLSGSDIQQALFGDAIEIAAGGYTEPMTLTAQGKPTAVFGFIQGALPFRLMTKPDITEVSQLEGKTLAISKIGSLTDQITRIILTKNGLDPNKIKYQAAGQSAPRFAALQAGAVDGTLLDSPSYLNAQKAGFNTLLDVTKELPGYPFEVLYAKTSTLDGNHDVYLRFMKGYIQAAQYATDPANKDEVLQIVTDATGLKADDVKLAYDETIKDFPPTAAFKIDGIQQGLDGAKQYTDLPGLANVTAQDLYYPDLQQEAAAALGLK